MPTTEEITSLLYRINKGDVVWAVYNSPDNAAIDELLKMELIYKSVNIYLLTKEGLLLVRANKTYDDYLRERLAPQTPHITPQMINSQTGTGDVKKSKRISIITIIEMIIAGLIVAWLIYYFGFNKVR